MKIANPKHEILVNTLVRWPEFPDRLYIVRKTGLKYCGKDNYCEIETIDKKWKAVLPVTEVIWDDVDYCDL